MLWFRWLSLCCSLSLLTSLAHASAETRAAPKESLPGAPITLDSTHLRINLAGQALLLEDPHQHPRSDEQARVQKSEFLRTGGTVVQICGDDPCRAPQ